MHLALALLLACAVAEPPAAPPPAAAPAAPAAPGPSAPEPEPEPLGWRTLEPGLDLGVFAAPTPSALGDSRITVLRVDPVRFEPVLLMASAEQARGVDTRGGWTAREWSERYDLVAAINAAMFASDFASSTHYLAGPLDPLDPTSPVHVNNGRAAADNAMLAFGPLEASDPPVHLYDRRCGEDFDEAHARYRARVQSIRMVDCHRTNRWAQQPKMWSHAVVGVDGQGRLLLVHARSPWTTHDFVDLLLALPIDLAQLQYAEGGPEATLHVHAGGVEVERVGSYETGFYERDDNTQPAPLPNVIGVRRPATAPL